MALNIVNPLIVRCFYCVKNSLLFGFCSAYIALLSVNVIGSLTYFVTTAHNGLSNNSGVTFGMSIFYLILFTPCSFVCWFRPLYKAFRFDKVTSCYHYYLYHYCYYCYYLALYHISIYQSSRGLPVSFHCLKTALFLRLSYTGSTSDWCRTWSGAT